MTLTCSRSTDYRVRRKTQRTRMSVVQLSLALVAFVGASSLGVIAFGDEPRFVDNSLLIAPEYPCTWPSYPFPRFAIIHSRTIGPESAYNIDTLLIDGNTGTQLDVPPHSVARR